jgi:hypothetical protein
MTLAINSPAGTDHRLLIGPTLCLWNADGADDADACSFHDLASGMARRTSCREPLARHGEHIYATPSTLGNAEIYFEQRTASGIRGTDLFAGILTRLPKYTAMAPAAEAAEQVL